MVVSLSLSQPAGIKQSLSSVIHIEEENKEEEEVKEDLKEEKVEKKRSSLSGDFLPPSPCLLIV